MSSQRTAIKLRQQLGAPLSRYRRACLPVRPGGLFQKGRIHRPHRPTCSPRLPRSAWWGGYGLSALPNLLFCANEVLHNLGDDIVLAFELGFQGFDLFRRRGAFGLGSGGTEGGRAVLKEGALPLIEQGRENPFPFTNLGDVFPLKQLQPQDADFLFGTVLAAGFLFHEWRLDGRHRL